MGLPPGGIDPYLDQPFGMGRAGSAMHLHTPFHPFQKHPLTAQSVDLVNLLMILLGVILVLVFRPFAS